MTENHIFIFGIVELLTFFIIIYLIIRANIFVNTLQQEINELHLYLPGVLRDIRYDLKDFNTELAAQISSKAVSSQKLGFLAGKIVTEILLLRFKSLQFDKKFVILSMILKSINVKKFLKPMILAKTVR